MTLIRMNNNLPALMENLFNRNFTAAPGMESSYTVPAVNVIEEKDGFRLEVAAPGLKKEQFKLNVAHNTLTISSEVENREEKEEGKYTRREFSYRSFQRRFTLPQTIDTEKITASYTDGVLHITLPRKEEAKVKPVREIAIA